MLFGQGALHGSSSQVAQLVTVGVYGQFDFGPGTVVVTSGINGQLRLHDFCAGAQLCGFWLRVAVKHVAGSDVLSVTLVEQSSF